MYENKMKKDKSTETSKRLIIGLLRELYVVIVEHWYCLPVQI